MTAQNYAQKTETVANGEIFIYPEKSRSTGENELLRLIYAVAYCNLGILVISIHFNYETIVSIIVPGAQLFIVHEQLTTSLHQIH